MRLFAGKTETTMDDVDRLFQCFKCGVSPPQSAIREKRKGKRKLKQPKSQEPPISANKSVNLKTAKQFSPVVFYGSPHGVPPKRPARLLKLLREIRIDLAEQNKLREDVWTTFPRQDDAMKFAKQHGNVRLFSYQDHMNGQRRFLVSSYKEFWRRYKEMSSKFRHHYEVIEEALPCHLYFDLEYNTKENADRNGDEMVDLLLIITFDALLEKYSIQGSEDFVIELDSSTQDKFSRHLIIHLPKTAFKDNSHVGSFVAEICSRIHSYRGRDQNYNKLLISKGGNSIDSDFHLFVDTAVYSRNRCFRLPFSSKAGKNSVLLPSGRFRCKDMSEEEIFMASLICNLDVDSAKLLICKMDLDCVKALHFETEQIPNDIQRHSERLGKFDINAWTADPSTTCLMEKSPFPALDAFIIAIASNGNVPGKIRSWCWFSEYALIVYSMSRNRYCERIGREHKSNHVIYVVDLRRALYYQKCHDPDCRGYRSPLREVPEDAIPDPVSFCNLPRGNDTSFAGDEKLIDSCRKEEWWIEAVRVAEEVEKIQTALDLTQMDEASEEDENWWMAAVNTASETELRYLQGT
ncbi:DNA-directed primase/polymerase protein isoform X3 [Salvia hispanica]|uniref:DNA-directed primase/polymerase protein isoform X3 n=1 Tax=Salvia hispanica TaxID=49212 RepID=UPI0020094E27|nr:DNA-directed primase/polymerase protein isoform X3 [Salvia hispanica]